MTTQTLKRNCKNLFTNSERLCSLERNIPKIKLSPRDKSADRPSPSPRLKSFPPEKIKKINGNDFLRSTTARNESIKSQNIGHGDAANNHENHQFMKNPAKNQQNVTYFYPVDNSNQSEDYSHHSQKIFTPLLTHRIFTPNSFSGSATQQCSPRSKATPRPIVSHLPTHRDEIPKPDENERQKTAKAEHHENVKPEHRETRKREHQEIKMDENKEIGKEQEKTARGREKSAREENDKIGRGRNQEFVLDDSEVQANYEKQPIGGRVAANYRGSYLKQNSNLRREFPQKELKQRVMQLPMSAPVIHRSFNTIHPSFSDKYSTPSRMENIKQTNDQPNDQPNDQLNYQPNQYPGQQVHNLTCQQHNSVMDPNYCPMQPTNNFYTPNHHPGMTSPHDFFINRQTPFQQFQPNPYNFRINPNNFQINPNNFQMNPHDFRINPDDFQSNPNNFRIDSDHLEAGCNHNQVNPNGIRMNPNNQVNPNNIQVNSGNIQTIFNDQHSQDHSNNHQFTSFSPNSVNPGLDQIRIVPSDHYGPDRLHTDQNKSTIGRQSKSPVTQQQSRKVQQCKEKSKVYYFTPQMLKDQELLLKTMQQQQFPEDVMMRQFQLLLNEQKKQLVHLENLDENAEKIAPRSRSNVTKKVAKKLLDEKPEWMAHITPPRITYREMEKIGCCGLDDQDVKSNWHCRQDQQAEDHRQGQEQQKVQDLQNVQNEQKVLDQEQSQQRFENQFQDRKFQCLCGIHQGKDQQYFLPLVRCEYCRNCQVLQNQCRWHQHCLYDHHQEVDLQRSCMVPYPQSVDHHRPVVQNQQSFVYHQQLAVPCQQLAATCQQLLVPYQQSMVPHHLSMVPQQQSMVPQHQSLVSNRQSLLHQQPMIQHHQPDKKSLALHQQSLDHQQLMVQHHQPPVADQKSLVPNDQSSVHQQPLAHHQADQQSLALHQQSLNHQQPMVQHHQFPVPDQKSLVPNHRSLNHQQPMVQYHQPSVSDQKLLVPNHQTLVHQQLMIQHHQPPVSDQKSLTVHQKFLDHQQPMVQHHQAPVPDQKSLALHQQFLDHQQPMVQDHQAPVADQKSLVPSHQQLDHQQPLVQHQRCSCPNHHNTLDQKSRQNLDENRPTGENSKTEVSSLLRLRYLKEIVQPQQRNNGLQDPDMIKEALEALTKPDVGKGLEYLANLSKKDPVIKLNGTQDPGLIPADFAHQPCCQKTTKNVSANGLENQRNPNNPLPPVKMKCFDDNQLVEYPRSKNACLVRKNVHVPEKENEIVEPNQKDQCLQEDHIRNQDPGMNWSGIIQHPYYLDVEESAICQNGKSCFVRY